MSMKLTTAAEMYEAARETCLRLFVANGGDRDDIWTVEPFPGTAAITVETLWGTRSRLKTSTSLRHWRLHMPAYPVDARLPRWHAALIAAYTVHELLHALWTDFSVTKRAQSLGVMRLLNALEDPRIEKKAQRSLQRVPEARRLLDSLTQYIVDRAIRNGVDWSSLKSFSFTLNCVLMREVVGYPLPSFPKDWRALVGPMLPLFEMALSRLPSCRDTAATLQLALDIQAASRSIKVATPPAPTPKPTPTPTQSGTGQSEDLFDRDPQEGAGSPQTGETKQGDEDKPEGENAASGPSEAREDASAEKGKGAGAGDADKDAEGDADADTGEGEGDEDADADAGEDAGAGDADAGEDAGAGDADAGEGDADAGEGGDADADASASPSKGGDEAARETVTPDLSDKAQDYDEAHLNDLAREIAKREGKTLREIEQENADGSAFFAATPSVERDLTPSFNVKPERVAGLIETPSRLRRHVINAVKAPERVGVDRRQSTGRFDMRYAVEAIAGASSVYRRRTEEEGREIAVSLLVDGSSSMSWVQWDADHKTRLPTRQEAAACLALHIGDALKIAAVPFEILGFHVATELHEQHRARVDAAKRFNEPWNEGTRLRTASLSEYADGGTALMLSMKTAVLRLAKQASATRRVLLALTDGMDQFPSQNIVALRAWAASLGVEIVGVAIQVGANERTQFDHAFGEDAIHVTDIRTLSTDGFDALRVLLARPSKIARRLTA